MADGDIDRTNFGGARLGAKLGTLTAALLLCAAALAGSAQAEVLIPHAVAPHTVSAHPDTQPAAPDPPADVPAASMPSPGGLTDPLPSTGPVYSTCPRGVCTKPDGGGAGGGKGSGPGGGSGGGGDPGDGDDLPNDRGHASPGHENDPEFRPVGHLTCLGSWIFLSVTGPMLDNAIINDGFIDPALMAQINGAADFWSHNCLTTREP